MCFEAMNPLRQPAMLECLVEFQSRGLHLHPGFQAIRRAGALADEAVDLFLDVDERLFHSVASISRDARQRKPPAD